ncbi:hypothetical protein ACFE04_004209 [Oxalis oulophora]
MGNRNSLQLTSKETMHNTNAQEQESAQQQIEFTCEICIEPAPTARKFNNNNLCTHLFCVDCIAKYIEVKILDNTAQISCPGLNCQHDIDPVSNMSLISKPLFLKWCDLLCEDFILGLEKSYCPNRECMTVVVNECRHTNVKKSKCPNCKEFFCFDCKKKWHAGFRCEENEAMTRDRNEILLGMLIERNKWQRCPTCRHCIQRRAGCTMIKCRCKTRFCYKCGVKWQEHTNTICRYAAERVPTPPETHLETQTAVLLSFSSVSRSPQSLVLLVLVPVANQDKEPRVKSNRVLCVGRPQSSPPLGFIC